MQPEQKKMIIQVVYMSNSIYFCAPKEVAEKFKDYGRLEEKPAIAAYRLRVNTNEFKIDDILAKLAAELDKGNEPIDVSIKVNDGQLESSPNRS